MFLQIKDLSSQENRGSKGGGSQAVKSRGERLVTRPGERSRAVKNAYQKQHQDESGRRRDLLPVRGNE